MRQHCNWQEVTFHCHGSAVSVRVQSMKFRQRGAEGLYPDVSLRGNRGVSKSDADGCYRPLRQDIRACPVSEICLVMYKTSRRPRAMYLAPRPEAVLGWHKISEMYVLQVGVHMAVQAAYSATAVSIMSRRSHLSK